MDMRFAILEGDFAHAITLGEHLRQSNALSPGLSGHSEPAYETASLEREIGRPDRAAALVRAFLEERGAWQAEALVQDYTLGVDFTLAVLPFVHGTTGFSDAAYADAIAEWKTRYRTRVQGGYRPYIWVYGDAQTVVTADDARRAVAALPEYAPIPPFMPNGALPQAAVGRTLWLAGREEEGTRFLREAATSCNAGNRPLEWIRAHAWLAEALEKSGDTKGACEALDVVLSHWGNAKPRSITADWSKARAQALRCERP